VFVFLGQKYSWQHQVFLFACRFTVPEKKLRNFEKLLFAFYCRMDK